MFSLLLVVVEPGFHSYSDWRRESTPRVIHSLKKKSDSSVQTMVGDCVQFKLNSKPLIFHKSTLHIFCKNRHKKVNAPVFKVYKNS